MAAVATRGDAAAVAGVTRGEEDDARKLLEQWIELDPEGAAMANRDVRYVSALFWVLSGRQARAERAEGVGGAGPAAPTMYELLRVTNTAVFDFFLQTSQLGKLTDKLLLFQDLLPSAESGAKLLKAFTTVEAHFIILVILFSKLRKTLDELLADQQLAGPAGPDRRDKLQEASWLLFLNVQHACGAHDLFPGFCVCMASMHAVLACDTGINPHRFADTDAAESAGEKASRLLWSEAVLNKVCSERSVVGEVERAAVKVGNEWHKLFGAGGWTTKKMEVGDRGMDVDELSQLCESLREPWSAKLQGSGLSQLDGRILIDAPWLVDRKQAQHVSSPSGHMGSAGAADAASARMPPPQSPVRGSDGAGIFRTPDRPVKLADIAPPATPLTAMQRDHAWLSRLLLKAQGAEDADLERFLTACGDGGATKAAVITRANEIAAKLQVAAHVQDAGKKIYYQLLRDICLKEEQRLKRSAFPGLLRDAKMHGALLALCFELVLHVYEPLALPFPGVLTRLKVSEFELLVMIENVNLILDQEPHGSALSMSDGIRRHVRSLQAQIVESQAWKSGSILLAYLDEPLLAAVFNREEALLAKKNDAARGPRHPMHAHIPSSPTHKTLPPPASPLRPGAQLPPRPPADTATAGEVRATAGTGAGGQAVEPNIQRQVQAFARRFWLRASQVLSYLLTRLRKEGLCVRASERAVGVLRMMAETGIMTKLLPHRHLHQVLLCVIFGACKVEQQDPVLSFKNIISVHRSAFDVPNDDSLYWHVRGSQCDQEVNVIEFYNSTFIPECKELLCSPMATVDGAAASAPGAADLPRKTPQSPTRKLLERGFTNSIEMTPRTSRLYTFERSSIGLLADPPSSSKRSLATSSTAGTPRETPVQDKNGKRLTGVKRRLSQLSSPPATPERPEDARHVASGRSPARSPQKKFGEPP